MNNFIKTFGTLSALMGVFFAFNFYANYGGNLDRAIFVGVLSGALLFGGVFATQLIVNRIKGKSFDSPDRKLSHVFKIRMSAREAEDLCRRALDGLGKNHSFEPGTNSPICLIARTGRASPPHGEIITFRITDKTADLVTINFSSESLPGKKPEEYGENIRNIEALSRFIENAVESDKIQMSARIDPQI
jgi:hypothetical protein